MNFLKYSFVTIILKRFLKKKVQILFKSINLIKFKFILKDSSKCEVKSQHNPKVNMPAIYLYKSLMVAERFKLATSYGISWNPRFCHHYFHKEKGDNLKK